MRRMQNRSTAGRATPVEIALVVMLLAAALSASVLGDQLITALNALLANLGAS